MIGNYKALDLKFSETSSKYILFLQLTFLYRFGNEDSSKCWLNPKRVERIEPDPNRKTIQSCILA
jgi:hypothetical protein